jgi:hypothetical protein
MAKKNARHIGEFSCQAGATSLPLGPAVNRPPVFIGAVDPRHLARANILAQQE